MIYIVSHQTVVVKKSRGFSPEHFDQTYFSQNWSNQNGAMPVEFCMIVNGYHPSNLSQIEKIIFINLRSSFLCKITGLLMHRIIERRYPYKIKLKMRCDFRISLIGIGNFFFRLNFFILHPPYSNGPSTYRPSGIKFFLFLTRPHEGKPMVFSFSLIGWVYPHCQEAIDVTTRMTWNLWNGPEISILGPGDNPKCISTTYLCQNQAPLTSSDNYIRNNTNHKHIHWV